MIAIALCSSTPSSRVYGTALDRNPRHRRCVSRGCSAAAPSKTAPGWKSFAKNASGEWSGAAVDFDRDGKPLPLPPALVPQEYVEWEVEISDWETYSATLADGSIAPSFYHKTLRLYPTVGCGATTVSIYSTEEKSIRESIEEHEEKGGDKMDFFAFHTSGSYVAVWNGSDGQAKVIEHCLVNEDIDGLRMRILHKFRESEKILELEGITVYKEQWEEPFQAGKTVESCLTRHSAFAGGPRLKPSDVRGTWQTVRCGFSVVEGCGCINRMVLPEESSGSIERINAKGYVLLPEGTWSSIRRADDDGEIVVEAGLLTRPGNVLLSRCEMTSSGEIQKFELETQFRDTRLRETYRTSYLNDDDIF